MDQVIRAAAFDDHQRAIAAVDRLVEAGLSIEGISLVMSDRTAERHFSPMASRAHSELAVPQSQAVARLAAALHPATVLGAPGTGVTVGGPLLGFLSAAGLGTSTGLVGTLEKLGASHEASRTTADEIRRGAVVVAVNLGGPEPTRVVDEVLATGSALQLELKAQTGPTGPVVKAPEAPAGDQHATYTPSVQPTGDSVTSRQPGRNWQP